MRILITGPSGSGKTWLADRIGIGAGTGVPKLLHTDDAAKLGWSEASEEVSGWLDRPGPWIIEGVAVPRALRKWRGRYTRKSDGMGIGAAIARFPVPQIPCDKLIILRSRRPEAGPAKPGHESMEKGLWTVLDEVLEGWPELRRVVEYR